jgi:hypothetical protein
VHNCADHDRSELMTMRGYDTEPVTKPVKYRRWQADDHDFLDKAALAALGGLIVGDSHFNTESPVDWSEQAATLAWNYAEAMLAERTKRAEQVKAAKAVEHRLGGELADDQIGTIISAVTDQSPMVNSHNGADWCFFCGKAAQNGKEIHAERCAYVIANKL